jgi:N-methylhydantoinase B
VTAKGFGVTRAPYVCSTDAGTGEPADPLTAEIVRRAIAVAAEEASIVVVRGAYSVYIVEGADAAAAILDARGRLVANSMATSLAHSASLRCSLPAVLETFPRDTMSPGDVFVTNDVYRGGIHANDLLVFRPVFVDGSPAYFTGTLIHVADLGGLSAGGMAADATEVYLEGVQLPPVRLYTSAGIVDDVARILVRNSRQPNRLMGDVRALVAGTAVAARRVTELVERYGVDGFARAVGDLLDYTARRMRAELAAFPDGVYAGEYPIDDDGIDLDREHWIRVTVTVDGDHVVVDFEGTDPQVPASINCGFSQVMSGAIYAVRCFLDPTIPMNEACFDAVEIRLPPHTLVNPDPPHPCGGRYIGVSAAIEAIYHALSRARPDHAVGASGLLHPFSLAGRSAGRGAWLHMAFDFGGCGARHGSDGPDASGGLFGGGRNLVPQVEPIEAALPVLIEATELIPDSGGRGRWRGGLGTRTVIRVLEDAVVDTRGDRLRFPPAGTVGGEPGRPGRYARRRADGTEETLAGKSSGVRFRAGDALVMETSGGGGLGPPGERDADAVARDVAAGRVTTPAAGLG